MMNLVSVATAVICILVLCDNEGECSYKRLHACNVDVFFISYYHPVLEGRKAIHFHMGNASVF